MGFKWLLDSYIELGRGGEKDAEYLLRRACNAFVAPEPQERLLAGRGPSPEHMHYVAAHIFAPLLQLVVIY